MTELTVEQRIAKKQPASGAVIRYRPFKGSKLWESLRIDKVISNDAHLVTRCLDTGYSSNPKALLVVAGLGTIRRHAPGRVDMQAGWEEHADKFRAAGYGEYLHSN